LSHHDRQHDDDDDDDEDDDEDDDDDDDDNNVCKMYCCFTRFCRGKQVQQLLCNATCEPTLNKPYIFTHTFPPKFTHIQTNMIAKGHLIFA